MPAKRKIKAIIFDLGGVLVHGGYLDFLRHYCAPCLTFLGRKKIEKLEREVNLGIISEKTFYKNLQEVFGVHLTPRQMHNLIVKKMKTDKSLMKFIPKLKREKVVLFSNSIGHMATEVLRRRRIPVKKLFDKIFMSNVLHMIKPDAHAYRYVLKKIGLKPHETLVVDDRLLNVRGAKKIGMNGIVYKNFSQFKKAFQQYELRSQFFQKRT